MHRDMFIAVGIAISAFVIGLSIGKTVYKPAEVKVGVVLPSNDTELDVAVFDEPTWGGGQPFPPSWGEKDFITVFNTSKTNVYVGFSKWRESGCVEGTTFCLFVPANGGVSWPFAGYGDDTK